MESKQALKAFAIDDIVQFKGISTISDKTFWSDLEDLIAILEPIHELQKMSESQKGTVASVSQRWLDISTHLNGIAKGPNVFSQVISQFKNSDNGKSWAERLKKQLSPLHWAAFFLHPRQWDAIMATGVQQEVVSFLERYSPKDSPVVEEFFNFRKQRGHFYSQSPVWQHNEKPELFWMMMESSSPDLARLTLRPLNTVANSVGSEMSFSKFGATKTKIRNRLSTQQVDKLLFIQTNTQALNRTARYAGVPSEEDLLAIEDKFLASQQPSILEKRVERDWDWHED